ncbi:MAPEG family protein [Asticcacaulis sp. DXS10W]|uniref:MAPEG family protein n=1 Tax=Asticcacaulis currens TaxID=2984210 RepID=A0ABT5IFG9_9CAUL|nr:MAPEG family protein [Asticcacaulis currens]MDC7694941.1 MAPEG family protein [Asticcacaulis currens]
MTYEMWILVFAAIWGLIQIFIAAVAPAFQPGYFQWNASPRDEAFDLGPVAGRMRRAYQNFLETFPFFIVIVMALAYTQQSDDVSRVGAIVYFIARLLYFPAYAVGVKARSLLYIVSLAGMTACAVTLFRGLI